MKIGPPNFWGSKSPFLSENSDPAVFGRPLRGNEEEFRKTKTTVITTISRLSSHPRLVKFGLEAFEL